jgi:membrane fusion protein, heavy metal efflux system
MRRLASLFLLAACLGASPACHKSQASSPDQGPKIPNGEVWLTTEQVKEAKLEVEPLDEQDVDDTILTSGKVTFDDLKVSHVFSPVSGRVTKIDAQLGQHVTKGDALATIASPEIGAVSADLGKAQADMIAAEHDFKRQKELFESHATSQKDLEISEDNFRKARAELERAKQKAYLLQGGGGTVTQGYTLKAALDGDVIARNIAPGAEVQGQYGGGTAIELFTIGELDKVWVLADIFEMDLARVKVGARVVVKIVTYPGKTFEGKVDYVAGMLDPVTRTARVRCIFDNPEKLLKPEMYATVQISVDERKALAIPRSALLRLGDSTVVFVELGESSDQRIRYERRPITIDETEGSPWLPVTHGLDRGNKVVVSGAVLLSGML